LATNIVNTDKKFNNSLVTIKDNRLFLSIRQSLMEFIT
jgi:hypothetical protein